MHLTRREFSYIAALTTLSPLVPATEAQTAERKIGWCMVGLGRISMDHFMPALKETQRSRLTALVSGHRDKAEREAGIYGVPTKSIYSYENFDSIRDDKEID